MYAELKIKVKSLTMESRIIRHAEQHNKKVWRQLEAKQIKPFSVEGLKSEHHRLYKHRIQDVRIESRAAQLAYAYMRNKPYANTEKPIRKVKPPLQKIAEIVSRFNGKVEKPESILPRIKDWILDEVP
jgi:hypothetical protein